MKKFEYLNTSQFQKNYRGEIELGNITNNSDTHKKNNFYFIILILLKSL